MSLLSYLIYLMGNKNKHAKKLLNRIWKTGEKVTCFAVRLSLIQLYLIFWTREKLTVESSFFYVQQYRFKQYVTCRQLTAHQREYFSYITVFGYMPFSENNSLIILRILHIPKCLVCTSTTSAYMLQVNMRFYPSFS